MLSNSCNSAIRCLLCCICPCNGSEPIAIETHKDTKYIEPNTLYGKF